MSFLLCSVESWPGIASAIASARQCLHASRQAFVVSQKRRIGACSKFTGTLKKEWRNGAFKGNYRKLRDTIVAKMPPDQTPNYYFVGVANPKYEAQRPFEI